MNARSANTPILVTATLLLFAAVLVLVVQPVAHSLAYAGVLVSLIALAGWTLEVRYAPDDEAAPSAWPLLLAAGIVAVAGGTVFDGGRLGLLVLTPLAVGLIVALMRRATEHRRTSIIDFPVEPADLARHAAAGDAIAIERRGEPGLTRRALLRSGLGVGLASTLAAMGGIVIDFLWQRNVSGFGGVVVPGTTAEFPPGTKTIVREGKFWLVNLTEAQGGPGYLALWQKCPHLGCVVPWEPRFRFPDPQTGDRTEGWFRCPCHLSTYNHAGVRIYGPAPRSMDRMALTIDREGYISVDTADISKGTDDNATFAVRPEA